MSETGSIELDLLLETARAAGATCFYYTDDLGEEVHVCGLASVPNRPMTADEATSILKDVFK